jgi:putative flippase GtrA
LDLIQTLAPLGFTGIVVVDDGSGRDFEATFAAAKGKPGVRVLHHAVNLGKGAALRSGFNYALCEFPELTGVVTADADGQHHPEDICAVAKGLGQNAGALVLGTRSFSGEVPLRSRFGNTATRWVVRLLIGQSLRDTQTGLRAIPASLLPALLKVPTSGYDFELDMLITAKHSGVPITQVPIRTIYQDSNRSSHFNPLFDSMRIYMVLLRFTGVSLITAVLDNAAFLAVYSVTANIPIAQITGRLCGMVFNYTAARKAVFLSQERHIATLPKFVALVGLNGVISYGLIEVFVASFGLPVFQSKLLAETLLFGINFLVQRDVVFIRRQSARKAH